MSAPESRAMVERPAADVSVRRQCALLNVARSGVYRPEPEPGADDLALMRRIDELHLELPFYGSRRMTFELNRESRGVNRKRVRRHGSEFRLIPILGLADSHFGPLDSQELWIVRLNEAATAAGREPEGLGVV